MPKDADSLIDFAKQIWGKRVEGLPVPELNLESVTAHEVQNLQLRYAFAQIINKNAVDEITEIHFIRASSGWIILDYGPAMTASAGELLFSHGDYIRVGDGSLERICSGRGTIIKQIVDTAADMARLVKEKGWEILHLVDGHPFMAWAIWKACQDLGLTISGYVPSKEEEARYKRIKDKCPQTLIIKPETPGLGRQRRS